MCHVPCRRLHSGRRFPPPAIKVLPTFLGLLLASMVIAEPFQLPPATDAPLTDSLGWADAACGAADLTGTVSHDDVESVCEELGLQPREHDELHGNEHVGRVIVDTFMFNNEFDILLIRLRELAPVVDYFVLVEAAVSHSGFDKPALFAQHAHVFHAFAPQLLHVMLDASDHRAAAGERVAGKRIWAWEEYSRAAVSRGLRRVERLIQRNLTSSDIVMVSDVDEIPSRAFARGLRLCNVALPAKMNMMFFYYSLRWIWFDADNLVPSRWPQAFAAAGDQVVAGVFDALNFMRFRSCHDAAAAAAGVRCVELPSCGWHMSFFGGGAAIKAKLASYSHQEWNRPDIVNDTWIAQALDQGRDLFPRVNHHGQLQPSFIADAVQCGSGSVQQQLQHLCGYIPHALCDGRSVQRFPSFFPWLTGCPNDAN